MNSLKTFFVQTKHVLLYGVLLALLIFLLKWLQWKFLIIDNSLEIYIGLIALFFTLLGTWVAKQLLRDKVKTVVVEKEVYINSNSTFEPNQQALSILKLSEREYEVLRLLANGNSNAAIAETLFLSLSTIKTHVSNLYVKMDVKNRTEAVYKARKLRLIE